MKLTFPPGWSSTYNEAKELNLVPPDGNKDHAFKFYTDLRAVKSTGSGAGTIFLKHVGRTPQALITWLTHDPDFEIQSAPHPVVIGDGIKMTSLTLDVSSSAKFGNPGCPSNPRCAAFFAKKSWNGDFFAIGAPEVVQLYLGTINNPGHNPGTFGQSPTAHIHSYSSLTP